MIETSQLCYARPMYKNELLVSWIYLGNVVVSLAFALVLALAGKKQLCVDKKVVALCKFTSISNMKSDPPILRKVS